MPCTPSSTGRNFITGPHPLGLGIERASILEEQGNHRNLMVSNLQVGVGMWEGADIGLQGDLQVATL